MRTTSINGEWLSRTEPAPEGFSTMSPAMADMVTYPRYLYERLAPALGQRIIEIGVGYGTYTPWLLEHGAVLGTDIADQCLRAVRDKYSGSNLQLARMDLNDELSILACEPFGADSIFCANVLEHIQQDIRALAWLRRIVQPRAQLALLVPAHPSLYGPMDQQAGHFRRYTRRTLSRCVQEAGWTVRRSFYLNALGAAGWWYHNRWRRAGLTDARVNGHMRGADRWLPRLARWSDPLLQRCCGLSVVVFAESY